MYDDGADAVLTTVMAAVRRHLDRSAAAQFDDPDTVLEDVGMDSLRKVALITAVEQEFGTRLPTELLDGENFRTARTAADTFRDWLARSSS